MADYSYEDVMTALRNADAAGDIDAAKRLAAIAHDIAPYNQATYGEAIGSALGNAASTLVKGGGLVSGAMLKSMTGSDTLRDKIWDYTGDVAKTTESYWTPSDKIQSIPQKVVGAVSTFPMQMAALPFSSAKTGADLVESGENTGTAVTGSIIDTAGNVAGMALPGAAKTFLGRAALGAGGNMAQDYLVNKAISSVVEQEDNKKAYAPTAEKAAVSGATGALIGGIMGGTPESRTTTKQPKVKPPEPVNNLTMARKTLDIVDSQLRAVEEQLQGYVTGRISTNDASEISSLVTLRDTLAKIKEDQIGILNGETPAEAIERGVRLRNKIEEVKARRQQQNTSSDITPEDIETNARLQEQGIKEAQDQGPSGAEQTKDPYAYIDASRVEQKTTPQEVALNKIAEAMNMSKGELGDRILDTNEKLESIPDTPENSSIRENLIQEVKAYESIMNGDHPDLSWFEGKEVPSTEGITVEEVYPDEHVEVTANKPEFNSISDIYAHGGDVLYHLVNEASNFFNRVGNSQIHFDKAFQNSTFGRQAQKIIEHLLNVTGFGKDQVFISLEPSLERKAGSMRHIGDATVIRINPENLKKYIKVLEGHPEYFNGLQGKALQNAKMAYAVVRVAAHEIGHGLLQKYARSFLDTREQFGQIINEFNEWKSKNDMDNVSPLDAFRGASSLELYKQQQQFFHEYFAERVANHLLKNEVLNAFTNKNRYLQTMRKVMEGSYKYLEKFGLQQTKKSYFDDTIRTLIEDNKTELRVSGETLWNAMDQWRASKAVEDYTPYQSMTLEDILKTPEVQAVIPDRVANDTFLGLEMDDRPTAPTKFWAALGDGFAAIARGFFNPNNLADMNPDQRELRSTYEMIRRHEIQVEQDINSIYYGEVPPKGVKPWQILSKIKNKDSLYSVLMHSDHMDLYHVHETFLKGFQEGLEYNENLTKNGSSLTDNQVKIYNTMAKAFTKMYDISVKTQEMLGKNNIMPERAGWYPAARKGQYSVAVSYGGLVSHVEQFATKLQADKFRDKLLKSDLGRFEISDVIDNKDTPPTFSNKEIVDNLVNSFSRVLPDSEAAAWFKQHGERILTSMAERGGLLGKHHIYRENVSGYMGSQLFISPAELGRAFGEGIEAAIAEKGMQLKTLRINTELQGKLDNPNWLSDRPNMRAAIDTMYKTALGRHSELTGELGSVLSDKLDRVADRLLNVIGKEKLGDTGITRQTIEGMTKGFFFVTMMPKAVFSTVGQLLSVPPIVVAKMAYDRPIGAFTSFARGLSNLALGNKELWTTLKDVSQRTNVFEPQFVESLTLQTHPGKIKQFIQDYVLLQAPARGFEALSRVMAFSMFYDHYRTLGLSTKGAADKAIIKVGDSLNLYDTAHTAPIFKHLGPVGTAIKPLQSYGQNALGNIIGMMRYARLSKPSSIVPLVSYMALTALTAGALGLPFVQEYEKFRRWLNDGGNFSLPSVLDVVGSKNDLLDPYVSPEVRAFGVPAASGLDLAVSARANQTFPTLMLGVLLGNEAPQDIMPIFQWATKIPGAMGDLGKGIAGNATTAEVKKALDVLAPAGHIGYGIKELAGVNETVANGANTGMTIQGSEGGAGHRRTGVDITAGILGTKSTKEKLNEQRIYEQTQNEKVRNQLLDKAGIMLVEASPQDKDKWIQKMVALGATSQQIKNKVGTEIWNRYMPLKYRAILNKNGRVLAGRGQRNLRQFSNTNMYEED